MIFWDGVNLSILVVIFVSKESDVIERYKIIEKNNFGTYEKVTL